MEELSTEDLGFCLDDVRGRSLAEVARMFRLLDDQLLRLLPRLETRLVHHRRDELEVENPLRNLATRSHKVRHLIEMSCKEVADVHQANMRNSLIGLVCIRRDMRREHDVLQSSQVLVGTLGLIRFDFQHV